jgi:hypothetical protein
MDTGFSLFPALHFIILYVRKEVVVFWQQCQWDQKLQGFSPPSKRIDNAELF